MKFQSLFSFGALGAALLLASGAVTAQVAPNVGLPGFDFKGRMLVVISDADMVASAYADGKLGPV